MFKASFFLFFCCSKFLLSTSDHVRLLINSKGASALDYSNNMKPTMLLGSILIPERPIHVWNGKKNHHRHHNLASKAFHQSMAEAPENYEQHQRGHRHRSYRPTHSDHHKRESHDQAIAPAPSRHHHHHHHHYHHHNRHRHQRLDGHASHLVQVPQFPYQYPADAPAPAPNHHHHHHRRRHHHHRRRHHHRRHHNHRSPASNPKESPWLLSKLFSIFWR